MEELSLPCGQCIGCKLTRSITWATRAMHEAQEHENNCFITLTYNNANIPEDYSLDKTHFQKFLKRLRRQIEPAKISYFMAGEYGDETWRPHYHALIFGYDFPDKIQVQSKDVSNPYFLSTQLTSLWKKGNHIITNLTFETAAYVARYCTKKITGEKAEAHYNRIISDWDEITGEINTYQEVQLEPEYGTMSRKPAIGKTWLEKYMGDCYPSDYLIVNNRKLPIPKYYDKQLEKEDSFLYTQQKAARKIKAILTEHDDLQRLSQIAHVKKLQSNTLTRNKI